MTENVSSPKTYVSRNMFSSDLLLEDCRTKWQYADWEALTDLEVEDIQDDDDRSKIALLISVAHSQLGNLSKARSYAKLSIQWGCSRDIVSRLLISSVENTLGRASNLLDEEGRSIDHFLSSVSLAEPRADASRLANTRRIRELTRDGLYTSAVKSVEEELNFLATKNRTQDPDIAALGLEVKMLRKRSSLTRLDMIDSDLSLDDRTLEMKRLVVLVAGVPRSGSTWVYNATRYLFEHGGAKVYGSWIGDYSPEEHQDCPIHIVKLHTPEQLKTDYDLIITTNRPLEDRLASLVRMGWLAADEEKIKSSAVGQVKLEKYWSRLTDLEVSFNEIIKDPVNAVLKIASATGVLCTFEQAVEIAGKLSRMRVPESDQPDPVTLIHPKHIATKKERRSTQKIVAKALRTL